MGIKKYKSTTFGLIAATALAGGIAPAAQATMIDPSVALDVFIAMPSAGPFESILVEIGFGGFSGDYAVPGEGFDVAVYDDAGVTLIDLDNLDVGNRGYIHLPRINNVSTSSLRVIIDNVVGRFELHRFNFHEMYASGAYHQSLGSVSSGDTNFVVSAVPEPGTLALFGLGLAGIGLIRRTRVK